ncbi:MAG: hypothetical protein QXD41_02630, partial [Nitrososphaeria archaeon]
VFGQDNVLVLAYEDFNKNPLLHLNRIYTFLGVSPVSVLNNQKVNESKSVISVKLQYFLRQLHDKYYNRPRIKRIVSRLMQFNTINKKPKNISQKVRDELETNYKKDVILLSDLCNYNFTKLWFNDN